MVHKVPSCYEQRPVPRDGWSAPRRAARRGVGVGVGVGSAAHINQREAPSVVCGQLATSRHHRPPDTRTPSATIPAPKKTKIKTNRNERGLAHSVHTPAVPPARARGPTSPTTPHRAALPARERGPPSFFFSLFFFLPPPKNEGTLMGFHLHVGRLPTQYARCVRARRGGGGGGVMTVRVGDRSRNS